MEEAFYSISMYFYNKNVLEYTEIVRNETESKIPYIEGSSNNDHITVLHVTSLSREWGETTVAYALKPTTNFFFRRAAASRSWKKFPNGWWRGRLPFGEERRRQLRKTFRIALECT